MAFRMITGFAELSIVIKQIRRRLTLFFVVMLLTDEEFLWLCLLIFASTFSCQAGTPVGPHRLAELNVIVKVMEHSSGSVKTPTIDLKSKSMSGGWSYV